MARAAESIERHRQAPIDRDLLPLDHQRPLPAVDSFGHRADKTNETLATAPSVIRNVSVPVGISTPGQPNIAATWWRTMSERRNKVYDFESAYGAHLLAVNLAKLDFSEGVPARKLSLTEQSALLVDGNFLSCEVSRHFAPAQPFRFLAPTAPAK